LSSRRGDGRLSSHADMANKGFSPSLVSLRGHDLAIEGGISYSRRGIVDSHSQRVWPPSDRSPPPNVSWGGATSKDEDTDRRSEHSTSRRGGRSRSTTRRRRHGENEAGEIGAATPPTGRIGGRKKRPTTRASTKTAMTMTAGNDDAIVEVGRPFAIRLDGRDGGERTERRIRSHRGVLATRRGEGAGDRAEEVARRGSSGGAVASESATKGDTTRAIGVTK